MISLDSLIEVARAVGEPNRLRMLCLCQDQRVAVSEFATVLGLGEPNVSRHLKLLEEAGLVRRTRQGQRVYFKATVDSGSGQTARALLAQIDDAQAQLCADRERLAALRPERSGAEPSLEQSASAAAADERLARALSASVTAELRAGLKPASIRLLRCDHLALLQPLFAQAAGPLQIIADDAPLRARLQRWLLAQAANAPPGLRVVERRGARAVAPCDLAVLDCSAAAGSATGAGDGKAADDALRAMLKQAATGLAPDGRVWLFVAYDALEGGPAGEHPLLRLRRLLAESGLQGERLQPVEAGAAHILFSVARPAAQTLRAAG